MSLLKQARKKISIAETNPATAKLWHPTKNAGKNADSFTAGSGLKVWWLGKCGHEWFRSIGDQIKNEISQKEPCPYCSGRAVLPGFNDLTTTHPEIASEWHPENQYTSEEISAGSGKKPLWVCGKGHTYTAAVYSRTIGKKTGCPYCSGREAITGENDLQTTNPELAAEWHETLNENLAPSMFLPHSNRKVWWVCGDKHEWYASINNRSEGKGCPDCWLQKGNL